jgi:hypothetical protein
MLVIPRHDVKQPAVVAITDEDFDATVPVTDTYADALTDLHDPLRQSTIGTNGWLQQQPASPGTGLG